MEPMALTGHTDGFAVYSDGPRDDAPGLWRIRVLERTVSLYSEDGEYLDGDVREVEPDHEYTVEADADTMADHASPVAWAVAYLNGNVWPEDVSAYPVDANTYLTRTEVLPYHDARRESSVWLEGGGWSMDDRMEVFRAVVPWSVRASV